jgi:hypothetical protein
VSFFILASNFHGIDRLVQFVAGSATTSGADIG